MYELVCILLCIEYYYATPSTPRVVVCILLLPCILLEYYS